MSENRVLPTPTGYDVIKIQARKTVTLSPAATTVSVPPATSTRERLSRVAMRSKPRAVDAG